MAVRVWEAGLVLLVVFGRLTCAELVRVCPVNSVSDSVLGFRDSSCTSNGDESIESVGVVCVTEGDEASLQRALNLVHKNSHGYVAVLFYASWCPFSATFRPTFSILSSFYPSIPHFAIEESVIRPSILSKYGVHGFPTLFLLNSTMRVRYHGSRTLGSLAAFYNDVTGLKTASLDGTSLERIGRSSDNEEHNNIEPESCPFTWARSPENLLREETYLALAIAFVLLRLLFFVSPTLSKFFQLAWGRHILNVRLRTLLEHPLAYLNRAIQLFNSLKEPCKRSNLQEGAINAKAWATKSLASVSFRDASSSHGLCQ
ncbi:5'-adenylylsulfate reductase-like 4 [Camellia lanceoleosa]|uniref:5'-adenylylsulfate reductase-like 4 n=1 Tax=Camellia lanceoleosa TaxID=1840588 RepID=A0ACC0GT36_9ERIC|nr:5'-adenylylsulfate reductase-like 4 [Camellia lanceoleosa]